MSSPGCSTLQEYNATYNRYYNKCSANAQPIAVRCYIKGLLPKYMKWVEMTDDIYISLPAARAAATRAVAKYDMLQVSYANHDLQNARASSRKQPNGGISSEQSSSAVSFVNHNRSNEGNQTGVRQNMNAYALLTPDDDEVEDREDSTSSAGGEAQVAALSTGTRFSSQNEKGSD